jgi:hypothetical protein
MATIAETLHGMRQDNGDPAGAKTTTSAELGNGDGSSPLVEGNDIPPFEGAQKAPDGFWYHPDSSRPGKYLQVGGSG